MGDVTSTRVTAFVQSRLFRRIIAYIYVLQPVYKLQLVLEMIEMKRTRLRLVVYFRFGYSDMNMECVVMITRDTGAVQQCEFMCTNSIRPKESVAKI